MIATMRATVLAAVPRPASDASAKTYLDVFLRQDGQQGVVEAYADPLELKGEVPPAGASVECDVMIYPGRFAGRMSVRVDSFRPA